jgi:ectoine hydroxylase-related dioxygenase (phytanoyl-CoA dioxygenase family)
LTPEERRQFDEQGYLVVDDALSAPEVRDLVGRVDAVHARKLAEGASPNDVVFHPNFIPDDPAFVELVDCPRTIMKVIDILGFNIYLYHAHLIVTPPRADRTDSPRGYHQDSGRVNHELEGSPRARLSLKVAYFLEGVPEPGNGNLWIVPGSHLDNDLDRPADRDPPGAEAVCVTPGTAVLFDRRLWHAGSANIGTGTRKVLFYGYGYRWLRTKDEMTVQHLYPELDPIRRQLLGDGLSANGRYTPSDGDVPLKGWLERELGSVDKKRAP